MPRCPRGMRGLHVDFWQVTGSRLESLIDHVLSAAEAGVFKLHPRVYQLAVDRLGVPASEIAFQSSNAWDGHAGRLVQSLWPAAGTTARHAGSGHPHLV